MAGTRARSSGLFSGLVLISVGILLLLHNYGLLELHDFFTRWWPLLIIFWGMVKLYERTAGRRFGGGGGGISGGEVLLVLGMLALLGIVVGVDYTKQKLGDAIIDIPGDKYDFSLDVAPKAIPANAHVAVKNVRGDVTVRGSEEAQIRVSGKKNVKSWNENDAERIAKPVSLEIVQNGDSFEVRPSGYDPSDARISLDLELSVPKKSALTVKTDKGDVEISDFAADVTVSDKNGSVEVRGTTGDVSVDMEKGDVKVLDSKGEVKISGKGGEIEANDITGGLTVDGDFYGPVRADKVTKGVRIVSARTDLTVSALAGHMEAGSGNLDLIDAPGNLMLRTRDTDVNVENPGGKVDIENRNAQTTLRYSTAPKEDIQIINSSSGITLTIPGSSNFEVVADCRNCDIETEFNGLSNTKSEAGDSHLAGKYGSGKGPKITLKTSYANIELKRTTVELPPRPPAPPRVIPPVPSGSREVPPATEQ